MNKTFRIYQTIIWPLGIKDNLLKTLLFQEGVIKTQQHVHLAFQTWTTAEWSPEFVIRHHEYSDGWIMYRYCVAIYNRLTDNIFRSLISDRAADQAHRFPRALRHIKSFHRDQGSKGIWRVDIADVTLPEKRHGSHLHKCEVRETFSSVYAHKHDSQHGIYQPGNNTDLALSIKQHAGRTFCKSDTLTRALHTPGGSLWRMKPEKKII